MPTTVTGNLNYQAKRLVGMQAGKGLTHTVVDGLVEASGAVASMGAAALPGVAGLALVAGTAAISAGLTQFDFVNERDQLVEDYKHELQAKLKLGDRKPGRADLLRLAKGDERLNVEGNQVLADHLHKLKRERNIGLLISGISSLGAFGAMLAGKAALFSKEVMHASTFSVEGLMVMGAGAAIAGATYYALKIPLHWVAEKLYDMDTPTACEKIESLMTARGRGKSVTPEQVFSVFVHAEPVRQLAIKQQFGREFDELPAAVQQAAMKAFDPTGVSAQYAKAINGNLCKSTELAFAAMGDTSGVKLGEAHDRDEGGFFTGLKRVLKRLFAPSTVVGVAAGSALSGAGVSAAVVQPELAVPDFVPDINVDNLVLATTPALVGGSPTQTAAAAPVAGGFVEKLGLAPVDGSINFAERFGSRTGVARA